jgi:hypothetical protein
LKFLIPNFAYNDTHTRIRGGAFGGVTEIFWLAEILPDLLIERKTDPSAMPASFNHASSASAGQSALPLDMATIVPSAS